LDIHKPKAVHTVREFLTEIGTIVTGILIALALEQGLENLHERRIKNEAREAVREEASRNLFWADVRRRAEPCVRQRLHEVQDLLDRAERREPFPVAQHVAMPTYSKITTQVWDANAQAGRTSLFGSEEQGNYGNFYFTTDDFKVDQASEQAAWAKLGALRGRTQLTPTSIDTFRLALAEARYYNWKILLSVYRSQQWGEVLHLNPLAPPESHRATSNPKQPSCSSITSGQSAVSKWALPEDMP
jgi:hypothetical protein